MKLVYRKDRNEGFREKRLGLLHPREVPAGYDFLNLSHQAWCHPCDGTAVRNVSFLDLYEEALRSGIEMVRHVSLALSGWSPWRLLPRVLEMRAWIPGGRTARRSTRNRFLCARSWTRCTGE